MKFEKSPYFEKLKPLKVKLAFGNYYFCDQLVIGEINEGMHITWSMAKILIQEILKFYGDAAKIAYVANRVNSYSIDPQNWIRLEREYNFLVASAIVIYNNPSYINASLEKNFSHKSMKRCLSLSEAISWVKSLREFN